MSPALLLSRSSRSINCTGFMVGCKRFAAGLFSSHSVDCDLYPCHHLLRGSKRSARAELVTPEAAGERVLASDDLAAHVSARGPSAHPKNGSGWPGI